MDNKDLGRVADATGLSQAEPASGLVPAGFDPSRWPSRSAVLAELKRRNPARYGSCVNLSYTPGSGDGATLEQVVAQFEAIDREMENPYLRVAARLGGEAFMLADSAMQRVDFAHGFPGAPVPLTREQKRAGQLAELLREAEQLLRDAAQAIEARRAETQSGSVEDESAGRNGIAPPPPSES